MTMYFLIPGRPRSKDNERSFNRHGVPYLSKEMKAYENMVKMTVKSQMNKNDWELQEGPLTVDIDFYFKNEVRGDLFNYPKSIMDAMNKTAWKDDRQIRQGTLRLFIGQERTEIEVRPYITPKTPPLSPVNFNQVERSTL